MSKLSESQQLDSYELDEPSDEERAASSSEDELDVLLNGTPEQKKKLIREYLTGESESSSGDDFQKEMEAELSSTMRAMEGSWAPAAEVSTGGGSCDGEGTSRLPKPQLYDDVYFDSDSDPEDTAGSSAGRRLKQRLILSNDELFYDPDGDDRDQAWVDAHRYGSRRRPAAALQPQQPQSLAHSDAILNCPACMTTLCLDCQRHETFRTQYRAMFVMNCTVKTEEVLRYRSQPEKPEKRRRKRRRGQKAEAPAGMEADEVYHPVQCSECSTKVAVFDKDEVYHFFNILASHC